MKFISIIAAMACLAIALPTPASAATAKLQLGSQGPGVTHLQEFLHMNARQNFYQADVDGAFGPVTASSLKRWQQSAGFAVTGSITTGSRQWIRLKSEATNPRLPSYLSSVAITAAQQNGWAVDASKSPSVVTVLRFDRSIGQVVAALSIAASYGDGRGPGYATHEGVFRAYAKFGYDFVSREYNNAPMPWAFCFDGGQCLHYDQLWPSHGCIHIPSMAAAKFIHDLPLGTVVSVHK